MTEGPAIAIMARAPRPGVGKSRLRDALSDEECQALQAAFVRVTVAVSIAANVGEVFLAYTPPDAAPWAEREFGERVSTFAQADGDLGERMLAALQRMHEQDHAPLLLIGTDIPLLRPRHLQDAYKALTRADLCLGPTEDGGYYLVGCHTPRAAVFSDVAWGTSEVLETTFARARAAGLSYELIEELYDVDTPDDLERMRRSHAKRDSMVPTSS